MGSSSSKLKRTRDEEIEEKNRYNHSIKKVQMPFIYTRRGSMYFDQDGDLAHEFYEEVPSMKKGIKTKMKKIIDGLTPQGDVKYIFPRLHVDFPRILI